MNGDGYSDVIVGAVLYDNVETDEGRAYVYHGSASGLAAAPSWTAEGDQASARFAASVATAGDVNGDGYSDVVAGAHFHDAGAGANSNRGRAYLYLRSESGLAANSASTGSGDENAAYFGWSVATAGDVNGDGYSDVIVGSGLYDNGEVDEGAAFVYTGSASGLNTAPLMLESNQAGAYFGNCVATAGDVNGDGYSDVLVSANSYDNGQTDEGVVFVYYGS